ncbi:MAG: AAA family ATPase, partial [Nitrospira sp.]|nr:AAA family ATPase [Nitrospira sp.]
ITKTVDGLDMIERMALPVIVVGRSGLGGVNHALLTLAALRQRKIPIVALALNQLHPVRTKLARAQEQSTVALLRRFARVPVVGPLRYSASVNQNWEDGMIQLSWSVEIMTLAKLVSAYGQETS